MVVAAILLFGLAFICFLAVAGNVTARINPLGLGLACCALYWLLQYLIPALTR